MASEPSGVVDVGRVSAVWTPGMRSRSFLQIAESASVDI